MLKHLKMSIEHELFEGIDSVSCLKSTWNPLLDSCESESHLKISLTPSHLRLLWGLPVSLGNVTPTCTGGGAVLTEPGAHLGVAWSVYQQQQFQLKQSEQRRDDRWVRRFQDQHLRLLSVWASEFWLTCYLWRQQTGALLDTDRNQWSAEKLRDCYEGDRHEHVGWDMFHCCFQPHTALWWLCVTSK